MGCLKNNNILNKICVYCEICVVQMCLKLTVEVVRPLTSTLFAVRRIDKTAAMLLVCFIQAPFGSQQKVISSRKRNIQITVRCFNYEKMCFMVSEYELIQ